MVDVAEARQLRKTTCQRGLTAFEAVALAAARTGLLTVQTATGSLAIAGTVAATDALAAVTRALCRLEIFKFHCVILLTFASRLLYLGLAARRQLTS